MQCDWHPYKKRKLGCRHIEREGDMKTQGKTASTSQGEKHQNRQETSPTSTLILNFKL